MVDRDDYKRAKYIALFKISTPFELPTSNIFSSEHIIPGGLDAVAYESLLLNVRMCSTFEHVLRTEDMSR